jgi:sigma-B regulation protein RsbU (phosphoserine phosphatase)
MGPEGTTARPPRAASLIVRDPTGHRARLELDPLPFRIGRHAENQLVIRDSRASRNHARILAEDGKYVIEDENSRHGTYVNGERITRRILDTNDRIEFGFPDSYELTFAYDGAEVTRLIEQLSKTESGSTMTLTSSPGVPGVGASLGKLRAVLEVARTLQTAFSMQDVLISVVDAALAITGTERGFLLLRNNEELEIRVARAQNGTPLSKDDLRVPRRVIRRALEQRRELLSMNFDADRVNAEQSVVNLELRSVICVPLVRIKASLPEDTSLLSAAEHTVGVLYLDSRKITADLAGGNRELLQTLAIEASTVLENARLIEEERAKQKIEEELSIARTIQQNLLPRTLPAAGWFRAAGSSVASHQVGGDYFDVVPVDETSWAAVVADVSGKGVSSALLASLLQGALLTVSRDAHALEMRIGRLNRYLQERTQGEKYATLFYVIVQSSGLATFINAGQCSPMRVSRDGRFEYFDTTSMPVGLVEEAEFQSETRQLEPGDKLVVYSDGVTEAANPAGDFFGKKRLREIVVAHAASDCGTLHDAILEGVTAFISTAAQADDITLLVLEYLPEAGC